jgi:hypothetical protein
MERWGTGGRGMDGSIDPGSIGLGPGNVWGAPGLPGAEGLEPEALRSSLHPRVAMSHRRPILIALLAAASLAACTPTPFPDRIGPSIPKPGGHSPPQGNTDSARRPQLPVRKIVAFKQDDRRVLVAQDGTWCSVTAARFDRTRVGDPAVCAWQV